MPGVLTVAHPDHEVQLNEPSRGVLGKRGLRETRRPGRSPRGSDNAGGLFSGVALRVRAAKPFNGALNGTRVLVIQHEIRLGITALKFYDLLGFPQTYQAIVKGTRVPSG